MLLDQLPESSQLSILDHTPTDLLPPTAPVTLSSVINFNVSLDNSCFSSQHFLTNKHNPGLLLLDLLPQSPQIWVVGMPATRSSDGTCLAAYRAAKLELSDKSAGASLVSLTARRIKSTSRRMRLRA